MRRSVNEYDEGRGGSSKLFKAIENNAGPALLAGAGAAGYADYKLTKQRAKDEANKREANAEMKRESRGIEKPANFDAIEEAKQEVKDAAARKKISDMGYASGGKVSSASKRADGIATKGKTKGTMIAMRNGGKC
jgi:hypothetical protein